AQVAPQPGYGGGAFYYVLLNGKKVNMLGGGAVPFAQQLRVDEGGNLWALSFDQLWFSWQGYTWWGNATDTIGPSLYPPPAPINPPYPVSGDDSTLSSTSGSLSTVDGVWTIDSSGYPNLNGIIVRYGPNPVFAVSQLQVNAHGQMFLKDTGGIWHLWAG